MNAKEKNQLQKDVVDSIKPGRSGQVIAAPRSGKTKIMIDLIKRDKPVSILWVTPSSELANVAIPGEFNRWKASRFLKKLQTTTWMSLHKITGKFDLVILDEHQFVTRSNCETLLSNTLIGKTIIAITGTETQHYDKHEIYAQLRLPVLYRLSINDAVDMGLLSNYSVKVHLTPLSSIANESQLSEYDQYHNLSRKIEWAIENGGGNIEHLIRARMFLIKNSPTKKALAAKLFNNPPKARTLMFCSSIDQANDLSQYKYHSKTDNKDLIRFQDGEIDKIAMVNAGGIGFSYRAVDELIMVQCDRDKTGLSSQKICRVLLQQPKYKAMIHVVVLQGTKDEDWARSTLSKFDSSKIEIVQY